MRHRRFAIWVTLGAFIPPGGAVEPPVAPPVIPIPASVEATGGAFRISPETAIIAPAGDHEARQVAEYLAQMLERSHALKLPVRTGAARDGAVNLRRTQVLPGGTEAYRLESRPQRVTLSAQGTQGLRHGATTLWQLVTAASGQPLVPGWVIADAPRFPWRGIMLDSARHYQSPEFIRQFIDWMAIYKLNVLHWHLTDDQAWRLEIKRYPKLTGVAAWRVPAGDAPRADIDPATGKPRLYGGFYSQDTVRALVRHAAERGVTIVPEIELPGHATATLAAYPELGTGEAPAEVPSDWGIYDQVYNLEEHTFKFLEHVLEETMALFPGRYIHVGGDEVVKRRWMESPAVQRRVKALGLKDAAAVQTYFTQRIARFLESRGRRLVGWDEILEPGIPRGATVMSWRGVEGAFKAAQQGFDTVLSPWPTLYFDNVQRLSADEPPGRGRLITLKDVYAYEPMPDQLTAKERRHVLGLQGNVWTEHIRTEARVGHMSFPRGAAVAELGWSMPARRGWEDFSRRLAHLFGHYRALGVPHADSAFAVDAEVDANGAQARVRLHAQAVPGVIRYTLDGSAPTPSSPAYSAPLVLPMPAVVTATPFFGGQALAAPRKHAVNAAAAWSRASQELTLCTEHIALSLEDDAPLSGPRAAFLVDIQNPCWRMKAVDLARVAAVRATVGQVPFNFQIGEDVKKVRFAAPQSRAGELLVRQGDCDNGPVLATLPLEPATRSHATTQLPEAPLALPEGTAAGPRDLCFRFAQPFGDWRRDPVWAIDRIALVPRAEAAR
ncbi:MAG: family 20 glycosylhydrolase [Betaproteobacteria bacterium]|nr:family 20 glycosylhydrolase [Betaproteobacteria bacterium]